MAKRADAAIEPMRAGEVGADIPPLGAPRPLKLMLYIM